MSRHPVARARRSMIPFFPAFTVLQLEHSPTGQEEETQRRDGRSSGTQFSSEAWSQELMRLPPCGGSQPRLRSVLAGWALLVLLNIRDVHP